MRQFNLQIDKTSPNTRQFTLPAYEHFSILVQYKNWEDKQEWLDYTLADEAGADIVKYKKELENNCVLYFCSYISTSTKLHFKSNTGSPAPRDTIQIVAIPSSTQDNCYICSADYARTTGEGGGGGVSQEYVDNKVQEEATARAAADNTLRAEIPTNTSQLTNDSGFLTKAGTIDNALSAGFASNVQWNGVSDKPTTLDGYGITDAATTVYVDNKVQEEATARAAADEALRAELDSLAAEVGTANTQLEEIA